MTPNRSGLSVLVLTLVVLLVSTACTSDPETGGLGPSVSAVPREAASAIVISPSDVTFRMESHEDYSWLVFLDGSGAPVGYVTGKGLGVSQIVGGKSRLVVADRERFRVVGDSGTQEYRHAGAGQGALGASSTDAKQESFVWIDGGMGAGENALKGMRIGGRSPSSVLNMSGHPIAHGYCGTNYYFATYSGGLGAEPGEATLREVNPGLAPRKVASWKSRYVFGRGHPIQCADSGTVAVPAIDGNTGDVSRSDTFGRGTVVGTRYVNPASGLSRWEPLDAPVLSYELYDRMVVARGSRPVYVDGDVKTYVTRRGGVERMVGALSIPEHIRSLSSSSNHNHVSVSAVDVLPSGEAVAALTAMSGPRGPLVKNAEELVWFDIRTGKESRRLSAPGWLTAITGDNRYQVTGVILL